MRRFVLDTNVLIDSTHDDFSPAAKLIDAILDNEAVAVVTSRVMREYRRLVPQRVVSPSDQGKLESFYEVAERVQSVRTEVQIDDRDDRKFIEAAVGGKAEMVVTSDRHLLDVGEVQTIRIVTPAEAYAMVRDELSPGSEWKSWVDGLGL